MYLCAPRTSLAGDCSDRDSARLSSLISGLWLSACFKLVCNTSAPSPAIITHLARCMLHAACRMPHAAFRALSMAQTMSDSQGGGYTDTDTDTEDTRYISGTCLNTHTRTHTQSHAWLVVFCGTIYDFPHGLSLKI